MAPRARHPIGSLAIGLILSIIVAGVPIGLWAAVGWPLPTRWPDPGALVTALEQRNVPGQVVVNGLAVVVWSLWAQLVWAVAWEATVNGRRLAHGLRSRPAPLVVGPLNALAVKLVAGAMAAGAVATPTGYLALPAAPSLAVASEEPPGHPVGGGRAVRAAPDPARGPRWMVAEGDSLWTIAEATFGDGGRSADVLALNPELASARALRPGMILAMPLGAAIPADRVPPPDRGRSLAAAEVEIERGDTLWHLAEHRLEEVDRDPANADIARYVSEVVAANAECIDDPDVILPGQVFTFPAVGEPIASGAEADPDLRSSGAPVPSDPIDAPESVPGDRLDAAGGGPGGPGPVGGDGSPGPAEGPAAVDETAVARGPAGDDSPLGEAPFVLGPAGVVLAAGVLGLVRRRRRYRLAHRAPGTVPAPPAPELDPIEQALHRQADQGAVEWLTAALTSLSARPIWDGERVAQPTIARFDDEVLEVEFSEPDSMAAPVPWTTDDGGAHWRLDRRVVAGDLATGDEVPIPTLVTVGVGVMVNLEALGLVELCGRRERAMDLVRSMVHELATSVGAGGIDVRATVPIAGTESYGLVRAQTPAQLASELPPWLAQIDEELLGRVSTNAYGHRLRADGERLAPVVVVTDCAGIRSMPEIADHAARRSLPLAVIVVDGEGWSEYSIDLGDGGETEATIAPWDVTTEPQLLTEDVARRLGDLLADASSDDQEPLVTGTRLSASVTDLRQRPRSVVGGGAPEGGSRGAEDAERGDLLDELRIVVLGEVDAVGPVADLTSQQLSLICYLACHGPATKDAVVDALWDGQVISRGRFPNLLAETRARIGRHRLPEARDGRYELRGVATDLADFERGVLRAQRQDAAAAIGTLRAVLELVRGVPFTPPGRRFWSWVGDQTHVAARVEAMVADTAARLARIEQERGNLDGARWACEQGLRASPTDETLVIILTELYMELGKPGLARRLVEGWEDRIGQMDCGEPSDEPRKRLTG